MRGGTAGAGTEQAEAGDQHHPRRRIEGLLAATQPGVVALEVGVIGVLVGIDGGTRLLLEGVELARDRRRQEQRLGLGADDVIGGRRPLLGIAGEFAAADEIEDVRRRAELDDPAQRLVRTAVDRQQAAHDRDDLGERCEALGQPGGMERFRPRAADRLRQRHAGDGDPGRTGDPGFGLRDLLDHALVGLLGGLGAGEDAMVEQHQAVGVRRLAPGGVSGLGQREARHDVGHQRHARPIDLAAQRFAVALVAEGEDRVGVGVEDVLVRQEGVQECFDRRVGGAGIEERAPLRVQHRLIAQCFEFGQSREC